MKSQDKTHSVLSVCQERNIEPMVAFESFLKDFTKSYQNKADDELRAKKIGLCRSIVTFGKSQTYGIKKQKVNND